MVYNPAQHIPLSKPLGPAAFPLDGKFKYYTNGQNGVYAYRPFADLAEVIATYPLGSPFREGNFEILVNTGGTLSVDGSAINGGTNSIYWWANGVLDSDLVLKVSSSSSTTALVMTNADLDGTTYAPDIVLPLAISEKTTFTGQIRINYYDTDGVTLLTYEFLTPNYDTVNGLLLGFTQKVANMKIYIPIMEVLDIVPVAGAVLPGALPLIF